MRRPELYITGRITRLARTFACAAPARSPTIMNSASWFNPEVMYWWGHGAGIIGIPFVFWYCYQLNSGAGNVSSLAPRVQKYLEGRAKRHYRRIRRPGSAARSGNRRIEVNTSCSRRFRPERTKGPVGLAARPSGPSFFTETTWNVARNRGSVLLARPLVGRGCFVRLHQRSRPAKCSTLNDCRRRVSRSADPRFRATLCGRRASTTAQRQNWTHQPCQQERTASRTQLAGRNPWTAKPSS